jgi:hypothetical protein
MYNYNLTIQPNGVTKGYMEPFTSQHHIFASSKKTCCKSINKPSTRVLELPQTPRGSPGI